MRNVAVVIAFAFSCTSPEKTRETLEAQGFTDIEITGHGWHCGQDDTCTGFTARGPTGRLVKGDVGCGLGCGKGCTVRITP